MRALHLGYVTDSLKTVLALRRANIELVVVNNKPYDYFSQVPALDILGLQIPVLNLYQNCRLPFIHISRFLLSLMFSSLKEFNWYPQLSTRLARVIQRKRVDFVFAHWGVGVLPEIALIKAKLHKLPVILNMETFPTSYSSWLRQQTEIELFKAIAPLVDGFIIPTIQMYQLIIKVCPEIQNKPILQKPIYYPIEYQPRQRLPLLRGCDGIPHLVFMGQFDASSNLNDVQDELISFAEAGIIVHCVENAQIQHKNVKTFTYFKGEDLITGRLTTFMTQFDACLVTYNIKKKLLRFSTSLPSRFLIALTAGIPIVCPQKGFTAMENFIVSQKIGYLFHNIKDCQTFLRDKVPMMRKNIASHRYIFDPQEFQVFLHQVFHKIPNLQGIKCQK